MEEKNVDVKMPRTAANVPRSARIVVNGKDSYSGHNIVAIQKETRLNSSKVSKDVAAPKPVTSNLHRSRQIINKSLVARYKEQEKKKTKSPKIKSNVNRVAETGTTRNTSYSGQRVIVKSAKIKSESIITNAGKTENKRNHDVTRRIVRDVQRELRSQDDAGMATLAYGIDAINGAKRTYDVTHTAVTTIHRTNRTIYKGARKVVNNVREAKALPGRIRTGEVTARQIRNAAILGTAQGAVKATVFTYRKTKNILNKTAGYGINIAVDALAHSENDGVRIIGNTARAAQYVSQIKRNRNTKAYISKAVNPSPKAAGISLRKNAQRESKIIRKQQRIRRNTLYKQQWSKSARGKATKAIQKAGSSISYAIRQAIQKGGKSVAIPLILILIIFILIFSVIDGAGGVVVSLFSPFSADDTGNEVDEIAWLTLHITTKRNELVQQVKDTYNANLVANGGQYHYVRFFNAVSSTEIPLTDTNILTSIYSVSEYQQYIQPIYHTILLSEYELEASETQMQALLNDIWDRLSIITTEELPMEYCHMTKTDNADGTYTITPVKDADDQVHAEADTCPNMGEELHHADNIANPLCTCDYYYYVCNGHEGSRNCGQDEHSHSSSCYDASGTRTCGESSHSHSSWRSASNPGCYSTTYCGEHGNMPTPCSSSTQHLGCRGYHICNGHKILSLTITLKSFSDLFNYYFVDEINQLEAKSSLTPDEQARLGQLKDSYEICLEYAAVLAEEFGLGGGTVVTYDDVTLTSLTAYACSFIGNPYVWGGNDPHTGADCSGFVQYVYAHFGVSLPRTSRDQVKEGTTVASLAAAQPGDLIFYSDDGTDEGVYHVTIYLGNNKIVHASNSKPYPNGGIKVSNIYGTIYKIKRIS